MSDSNSTPEEIREVITTGMPALNELSLMEQMGMLAIAVILSAFSELPGEQKAPAEGEED